MREWVSGGGAKIERAKEHIGQFEQASKAFLQSDPYAAISKFDPKSGSVTFVIKENHRMPPRLGAIAADAIHNLRCALDILWCQAFFKGVTGDRMESFPLNRDPKKVEARFGSVKKAHHKGCVDIIRTILANKVGYQILVDLNAIDVRDKHQIPILGAVCYRKFEVTLPDDVRLKGGKPIIEVAFADGGYRFLKDGAELATEIQVMTDKGPVMDMNAKLSPDIAFAEGEIFQAKPVIKTLHEAAQFVEGVSKAFLAAGLLK